MPFAEAVVRCSGAAVGPAAAGVAAVQPDVAEAELVVRAEAEAEAGAAPAAVTAEAAAAARAAPWAASEKRKLPPLVAAGERYYLRSVGLDPRKQANISLYTNYIYTFTAYNYTTIKSTTIKLYYTTVL